MDEVAWGPGAGAGSDVPRTGTRSAAWLTRLGIDARTRVRRLSLLLLAAGCAMTGGAQLLPWVSLASSTTAAGAGDVSITDAQSILQVDYFLTVALAYTLCGAALFAATRRVRRTLGGAALGAVAAHLVLLLPYVKRPYRLYGGSIDGSRFGDAIGFHRGAGMALGVLGVAVLGLAVIVALFGDRLGRPADEDDADRVRPSDLYQPTPEPDATAADAPARRWIEDVAVPATPPGRIPANQFAFEGHADLPTDPDAGTRPDHSMYMRPRLDSDISAR